MAHAPECHGRIYGCLYCDRRGMTIDQTFSHVCAGKRAVARGKEEIVSDVRAGVVPADVASFSALHDHVDANEYGGLCDDNYEAGGPFGSDGWITFGNAVQGGLDRWIKSGGIAAYTKGVRA